MWVRFFFLNKVLDIFFSVFSQLKCVSGTIQIFLYSKVESKQQPNLCPMKSWLSQTTALLLLCYFLCWKSCIFHQTHIELMKRRRGAKAPNIPTPRNADLKAWEANTESTATWTAIYMCYHIMCECHWKDISQRAVFWFWWLCVSYFFLHLL